MQYYPINLEHNDLRDQVDMSGYYKPYGIDLFIGETCFWNQGLGTRFMQQLVRFLLQEIKADIILIDPQTWNKRAIRCYEKVGFKKVVIIEKRELYDGEYRDSQIMAIWPEDEMTR